MSKVKITGNASGTGTLTIAAPNTNTDRSLTLPDEAGEVLVNGTSSNVGIGTSSPLFALDVETSGATQVAEFTNTNASWAADFNIKYSPSGTDTSIIGFSARSSGDAWITTSYGDMILRTGTSGSASEAMRINTNGTLKFNSGYGSVAAAFGCRAWVNFDAKPSVSIRGSGNVSSVTDHGAGDQSVNFSTSMPDTNYAVTTQDQYTINSTYAADNSTKPYSWSTGAIRVRTSYGTTNLEDRDVVCVVVHR